MRSLQQKKYVSKARLNLNLQLVVDQQRNKIKTPPVIKPGVFYWICFLILSAPLFTASLYAQARLEITESKKNFGSVKRGEIIKNLYEIKNSGDEPLVLTDAEVACSCTNVEFTKQPVLPGKTTTVTVTFNTATVYGRQDRIVLLKSNDPKSPARLRFKGTVSRE